MWYTLDMYTLEIIILYPRYTVYTNQAVLELLTRTKQSLLSTLYTGTLRTQTACMLCMTSNELSSLKTLLMSSPAPAPFIQHMHIVYNLPPHSACGKVSKHRKAWLLIVNIQSFAASLSCYGLGSTYRVASVMKCVMSMLHAWYK